MMTGLMDKRKRSREDEYCESTPLSKRINNLHINNLEESFHHLDYSNSHMNGMENMPQSSNHMHYPSTLLHHNENLVQHEEFQQYSYNPELSEHENPFYYNKNKLLHELHLERVKRHPI